jgi:hypothetical protein
MVSVLLPELWLHLRICTLGEFVIFYDITGSERNGNLPIINVSVIDEHWISYQEICIAFLPIYQPIIIKRYN